MKSVMPRVAIDLSDRCSSGRSLRHQGFRILTFQQFVGAWICRYEGRESGDIAAPTERIGIARCKAEILHIRRHHRYIQRLLERDRPRVAA